MKNEILRYREPAPFTYEGWERKSLPIGNGYMGACVYGGVSEERFQFNEKTLWSGGPSEKRPNYNGGNVADSAKYLHEIRHALDAGDTAAVNRLKDKLTGENNDGYGSYLNGGYLSFVFGHKDYKNYERGLRLSDGTAYTKYTSEGVEYKREAFASYPARALVFKFTASKKHALGFVLEAVSAQDGSRITIKDNELEIAGKLSDNGLLYFFKLKIQADGIVKAEGEKIKVSDASEAVIFFSGATDYADVYPKYRGENPTAMVCALVDEAFGKGFDALYNEHCADYKALYGRVDFDISEDESEYTDVILKKYARKKATANQKRFIEELLFKYARYLSISSSRANSLPANLQGVWNGKNNPPWSSDYHLNVNLQMCYWSVYGTNLSECALPLLRYVDSLRPAGRITAAAYHDIVSDAESPESGWVCHTQNTPFGWTCPGWDFYWGWSPAASSWILQDTYAYYLYTGDTEKLRNEIYPAMKENAIFWLKNLVWNEKQGRYVSSPTFSPEHGPISIGNTYEQELVWQLFDYTGEAAEILGDDREFIAELKRVKDLLKPVAIGRWGQIKEWREEDDWYKYRLFRKIAYRAHRVQNKHRHVSHLLGLYPGRHINENTPEMLRAVEASLIDRGLGAKKGMNGSGWGKAYKINLWARLGQGARAYELVESLIRKNLADNLWDLHPPFQIDGNFGYAAGVTEMLIGNHDGYVELLPALPPCWAKKGRVSGLKAKGNGTVSFAWENGKVTEYKLSAADGKPIKVKVNGLVKIVK